MKIHQIIQGKFSVILFLAMVFWSSSTVHAAPGDVDSSFNPPNFSSSFPFSSLSINATVLQSDGKIIVGGSFSHINGTPHISLARLNADGSRDTTFVSPFVTGSTGTEVQALALQPDGKILVGGILVTPGGTKNLIRVNADGTLDSTFTVAALSVFGQVLKIVIQPNGQILASGNFNGVSRLNSNGSFVEAVGTTFSNISAFVLQPDGKIVIGGHTGFGEDLIFRYVGMDVDPTFHGGTSSFLLVSGLAGMDLQPDGQILIYGNFATVDGVSRRRIARLTSGGTVDTSFDAGNMGGGILTMKLQTDGKIVIGGYFIPPGESSSYGFSRLNPGGALDSTFQVPPPARNINGIVRSIIIQPDGKILFGGNLLSIGNLADVDNLANIGNSINLAAGIIARVLGGLAPTAAGVSIGGRVLNARGRGIFRARVRLTGVNGETRTKITNPFGYYRFDDAATGEIYILNALTKGYTFLPRVISLTDDLTEVNFTAEP